MASQQWWEVLLVGAVLGLLQGGPSGVIAGGIVGASRRSHMWGAYEVELHLTACARSI
jgi:hypothetical protein